MQNGICKLCLQLTDLQDSHLLPKALYRLVRSTQGGNPNPVFMTPKRTVQTSHQIKAHLLCRNCEQRFSSHGESWAMKQVCRDGQFPLLNTLRTMIPKQSDATMQVYACTGRTDIDTLRLAYFAFSVLWRAANHNWTVLGSPAVTGVSLGAYNPVLRAYLYGQGPFPARAAIIITACTDFASQESFYEPTRILMRSYVPYSAYSFLARGILFDMYLGALPSSIRSLCAVQSSEKLVLVRNTENETLRAFSHLYSTSSVAENLN